MHCVVCNARAEWRVSELNRSTPGREHIGRWIMQHDFFMHDTWKAALETTATGPDIVRPPREVRGDWRTSWEEGVIDGQS